MISEAILHNKQIQRSKYIKYDDNVLNLKSLMEMDKLMKNKKVTDDSHLRALSVDEIKMFKKEL